MFGAGHSGLVFVDHCVTNQEEANLRLDVGFETWVRALEDEYGPAPYLWGDMSDSRQDFSACICFIGRYCRRVDGLFGAQLELLSIAVHIAQDDPGQAAKILDFVEYVFVAGMIPLGLEKTEAGLSLQVFVCD